MTTDIYLTNRGLDVAHDRQGRVTEEMDVHVGTEYIQSNETNRKCSISNSKKKLLRAIFVEFLGTLFYVFIATSGNYLATGFVLTSLMIAFGKISEGHFNPVVTLAVSISRGFTKTTILYPIAQIIGGIAGAALAKAPNFDHLSNFRYEAYRTVLGKSVEPANGILCEGLSTFLLVLTYLMCIVDKRNKESMFSPIAIGFVVHAIISATFDFTGGSMNPARSFGPNVCLLDTKYSYMEVWKHHFVYWVGPTAGSVVASVVYRFILSTEPCCCRTQ